MKMGNIKSESTPEMKKKEKKKNDGLYFRKSFIVDAEKQK